VLLMAELLLLWMTLGRRPSTCFIRHDVVPVVKNKTFIGVSYDFVTIPEDGKIEYRIMAQDGSGTAGFF
jgi:hypothetical protein